MKLKPWHLLSGVAVLLVALLVYARWERGRASEEIGKWSAIAKRLQQDSAQGAQAIRRTDSVHVVDTLRFTRTVTKLQTLRDSVLVHRTDTMLVERFVTASDSVVRACRAVLDSCTARVAARDSLITALGQQRAADRKLFDARLRQATPRITPYLEGLVDPTHVDHLTARAGLEVRVLGPVKLVAAGELTRIPSHSDTRALVGVRVTF